jgi:hypothetical protein
MGLHILSQHQRTEAARNALFAIRSSRQPSSPNGLVRSLLKFGTLRMGTKP